MIAERDRQEAQTAYLGTMLWSIAAQLHTGLRFKGDLKMPRYSDLFDDKKPVRDERTGEEIRQAVIESLRKRQNHEVI